MIRKITAISLILVATLFMLAHAVIPHHHNNGFPSLIKLHQHADGVMHYDFHEHDGNKHEHGSDKDSHGCILKQVIFIPSDILKHKFQFNNFQKEQKENITLLLKSDRLSIEIFPNSSFTPPPDLNTIYIENVNRGVSLRGPPVV